MVKFYVNIDGGICMRSIPQWARMPSLIRFAIVFLINIVLVICFENIFIYTLSAPEIITDYGENWLKLDFQSMAYFTDKEVLDSTENDNAYYVMYVDEGGRHVVKFNRNLILGRLAVDEVISVTVGDEISFKNFWGKDNLFINDDSINIQATSFGWKNSIILLKYVCIILLLTLSEYELIVLLRKRTNS